MTILLRWLPPDSRAGVLQRMGIVWAVALLIALFLWGTGKQHHSFATALIYSYAHHRDLVFTDPLRIALHRLLGTTVGDAYSGLSTWSMLSDSPWRFFGFWLSTLGTSLGFLFTFYQRGRNQDLQRQTTEARLKLLETQLEPHMLFNTLANLRALIATDPPRAVHTLDRLNDFLRASRTDGSTGSHTLADEFARQRDYLELMAVRMGPATPVVHAHPARCFAAATGAAAAAAAAVAATPSEPLRMIQASVGQQIRVVPIDEMLVFEVADKYVRVLTASEELLIRTPLKDLTPQLDASLFWQVHRGTVVRHGHPQRQPRRSRQTQSAFARAHGVLACEPALCGAVQGDVNPRGGTSVLCFPGASRAKACARHRGRTHSSPAAAGAVRWGRCSGVAVSACLGPGAPVRASLTDSRPLSERRERSERSEFGRAGPRRVDTAKSAQRADHPG